MKKILPCLALIVLSMNSYSLNNMSCSQFNAIGYPGYERYETLNPSATTRQINVFKPIAATEASTSYAIGFSSRSRKFRKIRSDGNLNQLIAKTLWLTRVNCAFEFNDQDLESSVKASFKKAIDEA